ncbi:MAG: hypothetical protein [Bacteriophage sp.]|nr:MAG: hypothetical protein [Bacteriophage sp.]
MRTVNQIQADISKLQAELQDVKTIEAKRDSAVHILQNLGWSWTGYNWKKPANIPADVLKVRDYDAEFDHPIKAGDHVLHTSGDYYYVAAVSGHKITGRKVTKVVYHGRMGGTIVDTMRNHQLHSRYCKVVAPTDIKL